MDVCFTFNHSEGYMLGGGGVYLAGVGVAAGDTGVITMPLAARLAITAA